MLEEIFNFLVIVVGYCHVHPIAVQFNTWINPGCIQVGDREPESATIVRAKNARVVDCF